MRNPSGLHIYVDPHIAMLCKEGCRGWFEELSTEGDESVGRGTWVGDEVREGVVDEGVVDEGVFIKNQATTVVDLAASGVI